MVEWFREWFRELYKMFGDTGETQHSMKDEQIMEKSP